MRPAPLHALIRCRHRGTRVERSTDAFSPLLDDDNTSTVALPTQSVSGIRIQLNTVPPGSGSVRRVGHPVGWTPVPVDHVRQVPNNANAEAGNRPPVRRISKLTAAPGTTVR